MLIVTCPCALALAAPVALSLGASGLNRFHLLAMKMSSIEKLSHVDTIVFDKTGTLTTGNPTVTTIKSLGSIGVDQCLQIAASMEQGSHHPFAKAIRAELSVSETKFFVEKLPGGQDAVAKNRSKGGGVSFIKPQQLEHYSGLGIEAVFNKTPWRLGNNEFIDDFLGLNISTEESELLKEIQAWRKQGHSILYLANPDGLQALFCISDPLRKGIESFLKKIESMGIKNKVILSGDHQQSVDAIAKHLGITEAYGGLSPEKKLAWVKNRHNTNQLIKS